MSFVYLARLSIDHLVWTKKERHLPYGMWQYLTKIEADPEHPRSTDSHHGTSLGVQLKPLPSWVAEERPREIEIVSSRQLYFACLLTPAIPGCTAILTVRTVAVFAQEEDNHHG